MFYGNCNFFIQLPRLPKSYDGPSEDHDPLRHVWEMLYAFTPDRNSTLQTNSLRFLSHLTFRLHVESSKNWCLAELGFTMSSKVFDCDDEWETWVETAGLNWHHQGQVRLAYIKAIDSCSIPGHTVELLGMETVRCRQADKAANELVALMCHVSRLCPQLTSNISAYVEPGDELFEFIEDVRFELRSAQYESG